MENLKINDMPDLNLKKTELQNRAKAVGLDGNSTEEQVLAAEKAQAGHAHGKHEHPKENDWAERAKAVGLPEDSTHKEILEAEHKKSKKHSK